MREYISSFGNWPIITATLFAAGLLVWAQFTRTSLELTPSFITNQASRQIRRIWR